jgi:chromosome segregation ATPase
MSKKRSKTKGTPFLTPEPSSPNKASSRLNLSELTRSPEATLSQSEALDTEIKSKQRILALLDRRLDSDAALQEQVMIRDRLIEEMNDRSVAAEAKVRVTSESGEFKELTDRLEMDFQVSQAALARVEKENAQLRTELAEWKARAEDEKEAGELLSEALTEEIEGVKAELEEKKRQVGEVKKDVGQLSQIIQDLTKLNEDLSAKVDKLNKDTAKMTSDYYSAVARADHTEQLDKDLAEHITSSQHFEKQASQLSEALDTYYRSKLSIEAASREAQSGLHQTYGLLAEISSSDPRVTKACEVMRTVRHQLKEVTPDEVSRPPQNLQESALYAQVRELKGQLKEKERQQAHDKAELGSLIRRLARIEAKHGKELAENAEHNGRLQKRASILLEQVTGFSDRLEEMRNEAGRKEGVLQKAQTQALHLQSRVEEMRVKVKDHADKSSFLERLLKEHKASILKMQTEFFEEERRIVLRERKVLKATSNLKALQGKLHFKDTELLKKTKQVANLTQQLSSWDAKFKAVQAKLKAGSNEEVDEYVKRLEKKSREVEVLREMIRGTKADAVPKSSLMTRLGSKPNASFSSARV